MGEGLGSNSAEGADLGVRGTVVKSGPCGPRICKRANDQAGEEGGMAFFNSDKGFTNIAHLNFVVKMFCQPPIRSLEY